VIEDFASVTRVVVPRSAITLTERAVHAAAAFRAEAITLWAGQRDGSLFRVVEAYVPEQHARPADAGACVMVNGAALFRFNTWLWERQFELIAQVHSHPDDAYLSETDLEYPIATRVGNFSIVVPNFGRAAFAFEEVAVYRYNADGTWGELADGAKRDVFTIQETL
jgi:proteasome lid subunit RPN8/RPN11